MLSWAITPAPFNPLLKAVLSKPDMTCTDNLVMEWRVLTCSTKANILTWDVQIKIYGHDENLMIH